MARAKDKNNGGNLGFEADLFKAADKLRGNMEPSDYKYVALGLIFPNYTSDIPESQTLSQLSDTLLPNLVSGDVRVDSISTQSNEN